MLNVSRVPHGWRTLGIVAVVLTMLIVPALRQPVTNAQTSPTYTNPLPITIPSGGQVESCPDPSIVHTPTANPPVTWYAYCTGDPFNDDDKDSSGNYNFHKIPIVSSTDLVHWTYQGDVFNSSNPPPSYAASDSGFFAPDIHYFNNLYYLYYAVTKTNLTGGGSAIGLATSSSPTGPFVADNTPVVEPTPNPCCGSTSRRDTIDPALATDDVSGKQYIFYGSYYGGIAARQLSADGKTTDPATTTQITTDNRYEAPFIVKHAGYYYLFASATNCCNGPLTGYSVFAGRSTNVLGPYTDREGVSMLDTRAGGTPVISMNGNRFVGPGHNAVYTDFSGQDYFLYHAVDLNKPYFAPTTAFPTLTRRPLMQDPLDWDSQGWPMVRGGYWASDTPQPAPAAQPGQSNAYRPTFATSDALGPLLPAYSDEFNGSIGSQWSWIRQPAAGTYGTEDGSTFRFNTQDADLYESNNTASVLVETAPTTDYTVETKVRVSFPASGCTTNCRFVQGGVLIYGDDDHYIKLDHFADYDTRQTEFAKETTTTPLYGNTVVGPPAPAPDGYTYLRIVVTHTSGTTENYRAYTSDDGVNWVRGGVWTHALGNARIGLVSMGGPGYQSNFDYVHVYGPANPSVAYVANFVAQRQPHAVRFGWRMATQRGVVGFDVYAGAHRLNMRTIAVHDGPIYRYTSHQAAAAYGSRPFTLRVLLSSGRYLTVSTR